MKNKIKKIERFVTFVASVVAIVASIYVICTISTVYTIPKPVIDFCPSIIGACSSCDSRDIINTCGEEKKTFTLSCRGDGEHFQIISNIYNKGSALATNIQMEIQFENNTLLTEEDLMLGWVDIYENGVTRKARIGCYNNKCLTRIRVPVLKPSDSFEIKITFDRRDFKKRPKTIEFILYKDDKFVNEKIININYSNSYNEYFSIPRTPHTIDGIITYKRDAVINATVLIINKRTNENTTTTTNELGQYSVDLSNMKSNIFHGDFILVESCFEDTCSEKMIEANTALGANEVNIIIM